MAHCHSQNREKCALHFLWHLSYWQNDSGLKYCTECAFKKGPLGQVGPPLSRKPLGFQCNLSQGTGNYHMPQNSSIFKGFIFIIILKVQYSFSIEKPIQLSGKVHIEFINNWIILQDFLFKTGFQCKLVKKKSHGFYKYSFWSRRVINHFSLLAPVFSPLWYVFLLEGAMR